RNGIRRPEPLLPTLPPDDGHVSTHVSPPASIADVVSGAPPRRERQPSAPFFKFTVCSSSESSKSSGESCARVLTLTLLPSKSCPVRPPRSSCRRQDKGRLILTVSFITYSRNPTRTAWPTTW